MRCFAVHVASVEMLTTPRPNSLSKVEGMVLVKHEFLYNLPIRQLKPTLIHYKLKPKSGLPALLFFPLELSHFLDFNKFHQL